MGRVYKALDQKLNEEVALKLVRPEIAPDRKSLERFSAELRIARKIVHKNVGRVYELMEDHGDDLGPEHYWGLSYRSLLTSASLFSSTLTPLKWPQFMAK